MEKLTAKQQRFCDEYLIDLNATRAALRAGYSAKTAYRTGADNLKKPQIQEFLAERMKEKESELIAGQDEVLRYLTGVMRGETQAEVVVVENIGDYRSEARAMQKAPDEKELLGKRYGLFTDKLDVQAAERVVIVDDLGEKDGG